MMATDGKLVEETERRSVDYALFTILPMALIADVARHVGDSRDLFGFATANGKGLRVAAEHYVKYLVDEASDPYAGVVTCCPEPWPVMQEQFRAVYELFASVYPAVDRFQQVVTFGGDSGRADNFDLHIYGHNAIAGGLPASPPP
jgi:hypothetical protein